MEALKQNEILEREELILRQHREEQERTLRQNVEEEINKLQIRSQREEWEIMNRKRILEKQIHIKCAAIENDVFDKMSEKGSFDSGPKNTKF